MKIEKYVLQCKRVGVKDWEDADEYNDIDKAKQRKKNEREIDKKYGHRLSYRIIFREITETVVG